MLHERGVDHKKDGKGRETKKKATRKPAASKNNLNNEGKMRGEKKMTMEEAGMRGVAGNSAWWNLGGT